MRKLKTTALSLILVLTFVVCARIFYSYAETKGLSPQGTVPEIVEDLSGDIKEALK